MGIIPTRKNPHGEISILSIGLKLQFLIIRKVVILLNCKTQIEFARTINDGIWSKANNRVKVRFKFNSFIIINTTCNF